jgi:hypothetical protein
MSLGQIAKVLWGSCPKVHRAPRRKRPGSLDVFWFPHREKRVALGRSSSLEVARSPGIHRHPLPDQKTNPRWLPPYCLGRRRPSQRPAVVPSSDDLQISQGDILFSKTKTAPRQFKNTPSVKTQLRFDASDDGEDDDESSSSSDDRVPSSHIPRERRAGASMRRKEHGLSSLGDK